LSELCLPLLHGPYCICAVASTLSHPVASLLSTIAVTCRSCWPHAVTDPAHEVRFGCWVMKGFALCRCCTWVRCFGTLPRYVAILLSLLRLTVSPCCFTLTTDPALRCVLGKVLGYEGLALVVQLHRPCCIPRYPGHCRIMLQSCCLATNVSPVASHHD
jgi:hypothetical protein